MSATQKQKPAFLIVRDAVLPISGLAKSLLLYLATFGDHDGQSIFPSITTLARIMGFTDRRIQQAMREALVSGYLELEAAGGGHRTATNRYKLRIDRILAPDYWQVAQFRLIHEDAIANPEKCILIDAERGPDDIKILIDNNVPLEHYFAALVECWATGRPLPADAAAFSGTITARMERMFGPERRAQLEGQYGPPDVAKMRGIFTEFVGRLHHEPTEEMLHKSDRLAPLPADHAVDFAGAPILTGQAALAYLEEIPPDGAVVTVADGRVVTVPESIEWNDARIVTDEDEAFAILDQALADGARLFQAAHA